MLRLILICLLLPILSTQSYARDKITVVGTSTAFSFAQCVAQGFESATGNNFPNIATTGSSAGINLFCRGIGTHTPDITISRRKMKRKELHRCKTNGISKIGLDSVYIGGYQHYIYTKKAHAGLVPGLNSYRVYLVNEARNALVGAGPCAG